ncbi:MAG: type II toxin-antitoxin system HicA family toxin [Sphaerobacteraceae bacterium]|nr:MAG: type II toxin-antitoxin system HicA family toxin [Sphaerobacteraceae bacterium]
MSRLPRVSGRETVRALERAGFVVSRQRGSHVRLFRAGVGQVIVPLHGNRDIPAGTLRNILRQANLSVDEFIELLEG